MVKKLQVKPLPVPLQKVLRDGRTSAASKTAAASALSQREKGERENKQ